MFTSIPTVLVEDKNIPPTVFKFYAVLMNLANKDGLVEITNTSLERKLSSGTSIELSVDYLVKMGYLSTYSEGYIVHTVPNKLRVNSSKTLFGETLVNGAVSNGTKTAYDKKRQKYAQELYEINLHFTSLRKENFITPWEVEGKTHNNRIMRALENNYSVEELKKIATRVFQEKWYLDNPVNLVPSTVFKLNTLEKYRYDLDWEEPTVSKMETVTSMTGVEF